MIKHIDTRRMQSCGNVYRKCFPGCSSEDMKHYIIPSLSRKPDQVVIHVGTNDLKHVKDPRNLANNIIDLANKAAGSEKRKVLVSGIICHCDSSLNNKINGVNNLLKSFCQRHSWSFIDNSNILSNHLNEDGIHLNRKGTSVLVKSISSFTKYNPN